MAPPSKSGVSPIVWILLLVVALCLVMGVGGLVMCRSVVGQATETAGCAITGSMIQKATLAYAQEKGQLPPAATWQDDIRPYYGRLHGKMKSEMDKEMEGAPGFATDMVKGMIPPGPDEEWVCKTSGRLTGLFYNKDVAGKTLAQITDKAGTPLVFEADLPTDGNRKNLNMAYARQDPKKAPKILNERRDWLVIHFEGDPDFGKSSSSSSMDFDFKTEDALEPKPGEAPSPVGETQ